MTPYIEFKIICTNIKLIFFTLIDVSIMVAEKQILKKVIHEKKKKEHFYTQLQKML